MLRDIVFLVIAIGYTASLFAQSDKYKEINIAFKAEKYEDVIAIYNAKNQIEKEPMQLKINMMVGEAACETNRTKSGKKMYNHIIKNYKKYLPSNYIQSLKGLRRNCGLQKNLNGTVGISTERMMLFRFIVANETMSTSFFEGFIEREQIYSNNISTTRDQSISLRDQELVMKEQAKVKNKFLKPQGKLKPRPPKIKMQ